VLCPAPVPEANRGDQALLAVAMEGLLRTNPRRIDVVATSWRPIESVKSTSKVRIRTDLHLAFGTQRALREQIAYLRLLRGAKSLVLIGADVLDEGYSVSRSEASLYSLELAAKLGVATRVVSFSINGSSSPALDERLRRVGRHTRLFVRDPVTYRRLAAAGVGNIVQAGDLAYLLEPAPVDAISDDLRPFIEQHQGRLIGLNLTAVVLGQYGEEETRLANLAKACAKLAAEDGMRFLLIPHDEPEGVDYLRSFLSRLEAIAPGAAKLVEPLPHVAALKRLAGCCRHLFTCRLHLGIGALGMCTPLTGFPYQGKFEGQFELFGLSSDGLIGPSSFPDSANGLAELMRHRIEQSDELSDQIKTKLPSVRELALRNFEGL